MTARSRRNRRSPRQRPAPPPTPVARPPRTDIEVSVEDLNERVFDAVDAVAGRLVEGLERATSLERMHFNVTLANLLLAMRSTHRSICVLLGRFESDLSLSVDVMPLARVQLERCFLSLLLADNPERWHARYRRNAWKAFAEKFFRDQATVGHLEQFDAYFGSGGRGVRLVREFAREMDVSEDELHFHSPPADT